MNIELDRIYNMDCLEGMKTIPDGVVDCIITSPPYFVGKEYEQDATYDEWQSLLKAMVSTAADKLKAGCFLVVNIADILAFKDETMPRFQANNPDQHCDITAEMVKTAREEHPDFSKQQLADLLGCSNQTIDRRLNGNNARGGKADCATRVKLVGGSLEAYAYEVGLYLYDKRIWHKDPAWATSRWTISTLKAVSETEDIYVFWKPGEYTVNRNRLSQQEWREWGMRQIWDIPSVRANDIHPAMFPETLARRIVRLYTDKGALVIDPFIGSGTTAIACIKERRHFIGFELNKDYYDKACKRIELERQQLTLF